MSLVALLSSMARTRQVPKRGWKVLTGKQKRDFNKGKRSMKAGFMDRLSNFVVVPSMLPQYKVPDFPSSFALKPYVARTAPKEGEGRRR